MNRRIRIHTTSSNGAAAFGLSTMLGLITAVIIGVIGYVMNIIALAGSDSLNETAIRALGAIIPFVGAIIGYLTV